MNDVSLLNHLTNKRPPRLLLVLMLAVFGHFSLHAQTTVTGKVTDETGAALPGVNILVRNTAVGTTSDANGEYSLAVSGSDGTVLVFSFIGFETQEVPLGGRTSVDVQMVPSFQSLSEVVVVGYGTQKKTDLTGSVASVNIDDLKNAPNTNIGQLLQGTVPGLNVGVGNSAGATPPISIRGRVTLNGSQNVLIILDGVQYTGSLSSINPDDIASIDVLKDASSTAVYGAQAANGVILITTKRGNAGEKPRITFTSQYSTQTPTVGDLVPMNREQYLQGITDAWYEEAYTAESGYTVPNPSFNVATKVDGSMVDPDTGELLPNDFNWWEAGTNTGSIFENNLSISGGTDKVNYLLSGGIVDQKGYIINDKFNRKTLRANLEIKPLEWLKIGLVSSGAFVNQDGAEPSLASLQRASPLHVPFDEDGNLIPSPTNTIELNPFITYYVDDYDRHNYLFANVYTEIDIPFIKGLTYRMNFGNNYRTDKHYYASEYDNNGSGRAYRDDRQYYDYTFDNILTYKNTFDKHDVGVTLLYGAIERQFDRTYVEGSGFSRLNLSYNNIGSATNLKVSSNDPNYAWQEQLLYQMARVNYKYNNRYLLTATVRRDGFSGFSKNHKFAVFPTVAAAWVLSEESFMQDINAINQFKVRVAYGESGNQTPRGSSLAKVTAENAVTIDGTRYYTAYLFGDGGNTAFGQQVNTLGNDDLKWERTKGLNIGLDFTLFSNKTKGSIDFYNNNTNDLLYEVPVPRLTGFSGIQSNLGQINNKGLEIALTQLLLNKKGFEWSATLNFSTNKNKIVSLTGQDLNGDGQEDDLIPATDQPTRGLFIGEPIGAVYYFEPTGQIYDLDDTRLPGFQIGTASYVDQNGDNDITAADRIILGSTQPAYRISLMSNLYYKGFNFSFLINSVQGGNDKYLGISAPTSYNNIPMYYREDNTIRWNDFVGMDYWSPNNPDGKYPRNISGVRSRFDGRPFEDRSFVRLQDVSLSYDLKYSLLKNANFQNINIFVSGKNLQTWTKWDGFDPESEQAFDGNRPNDFSAVGLVAGGRPVLRAFTVGLSVTY